MGGDGREDWKLSVTPKAKVFYKKQSGTDFWDGQGVYYLYYFVHTCTYLPLFLPLRHHLALGGNSLLS